MSKICLIKTSSISDWQVNASLYFVGSSLTDTVAIHWRAIVSLRVLFSLKSITNDIISYITSIMTFKISLMLTYLRFMPKGAARTATIVVIVLCILFHLAFLTIQINLCQPVRRLLHPPSNPLLTPF